MEPRVFRPGFVAILARMRDGVETPAQRAAMNIERANVPGRCGMGFRIATAHDNQVLVNDARRGQRDRLFAIIPAKVFAKVDAAVFSEARDWFAIAWVECVEKICNAGEEPAPGTIFRMVRPPGKAPHRLCASHAGVEAPDQLSRCSVE